MTSDIGVFYAVQINPGQAPQRVKFGFTADITARVRVYRGIVPEAVLVRTWPCRRKDELFVIRSLPLMGCKQITISGELCEVDDFNLIEGRITAAVAEAQSEEFISDNSRWLVRNDHRARRRACNRDRQRRRRQRITGART